MKYRNTLLAVIFGICCSSFGFATTHPASLDPLREFSVITRNDLKRVGEVEGKTFVGGTITFNQSANFGIKLIPSNDAILLVAGDVLAGNPLNANSGVTLVGGSTNGRIINGQKDVLNDPGEFAYMFEQLDNTSAALGLYTTSTVSFPGASSQPSPVIFNPIPDAAGTAFFTFNGSEFFSNGKIQHIDFVANDVNSIVFNVLGETINWSGPSNLVGNFNSSDWQGRIIWNFVEATSVDFGSHAISGTVIAPYAEVKSSNNINGSVYANSLNMTGEVHLPTYSGNPTIPEPSTSFLGSMFAALLVLTRKRRH